MSIHAIPGHFPLPRIKTNLNSDEFSFVRVGAYLIRPTDGHASGRMDRKIAIFQVARVGRNSIRPTNGPHGIESRNTARFPDIPAVGRNSIRPTDTPIGGEQGNEKRLGVPRMEEAPIEETRSSRHQAGAGYYPRLSLLLGRDEAKKSLSLAMPRREFMR